MADESVQGTLWGSQRFQGNTQPNWYRDLSTAAQGSGGNVANNVIYRRPNHPIAGENLEATDRGWERVVRYTDGQGVSRTKREVVVAQGGLANTLAYGTVLGEVQVDAGGPQIVDIRWREANTVSDSPVAYPIGTVEAARVGVIVTYSESVAVTGVPQIAVAGAGGLTLDCVSGNNTNKLTFAEIGTPASKTQAEFLSMVDSKTFIALNGGTIHGMQANTGYGRSANTPYPELFRVANVSSHGIASAQAGASLTLAVDAGRKQVKPT